MGGALSLVGGGNNANVINEMGNVTNNYMQIATQKCTTACSNEIVGNRIIVNGTTVNGNIGISQTCNINQGCSFSNNIQALTINQISSSAEQKYDVKNGLFSIFAGNNLNEANYTVNVNNTMQQILQSECNATSDNLFANNLVFFTNANINGDFTLTQDNNATNQCVMNNLAKIEAYTKSVANFDQTGKATTAFAGIIIAIIVLVVIVVLGGLLLLLAFGGIGGITAIAGGKKSSDSSDVVETSSGSSGGLVSEAVKAAPLALLAA